MEIKGRFGKTYGYIEFEDLENNDCHFLGSFYNQFVDFHISYIIDCIRCRSNYIYCQEQPMFKNGGFEFNIVKSPYYDACMDFVVEAFPENGEEWDYDYILSDWIKSLMSADTPDCEIFGTTSLNEKRIVEIFHGMCASLLEFCGDDYECYLIESINEFAHSLTERAKQHQLGNFPLETATQTA